MVVAAPASASPELSDRPRRRTFTAQTTLRILTEIYGAADTGRIGAILRREGIYSSSLCDWRRQRDAGAFNALVRARTEPEGDRDQSGSERRCREQLSGPRPDGGFELAVCR